MNVVCVLKSGGDYGPEYAINLRDALKKNLDPSSYEFVVFTDDEETRSDLAITSIQLRHDLPGWWSKLEAFRMIGPTLYLDLDTFIAGDLNLGFRSLATEFMMGDHVKSFHMMKPFKKTEQWASGIMAWSGNWHHLLGSLRSEDISIYEWDQRYIVAKIQERKARITSIQEHFSNIVSYKHHCKKGIPKGTELVCFHGHPRPHEVGGVYFS